MSIIFLISRSSEGIEGAVSTFKQMGSTLSKMEILFFNEVEDLTDLVRRIQKKEPDAQCIVVSADESPEAKTRWDWVESDYQWEMLLRYLLGDTSTDIPRMLDMVERTRTALETSARFLDQSRNVLVLREPAEGFLLSLGIRLGLTEAPIVLVVSSVGMRVSIDPSRENLGSIDLRRALAKFEPTGLPSSVFLPVVDEEGVSIELRRIGQLYEAADDSGLFGLLVGQERILEGRRYIGIVPLASSQDGGDMAQYAMDLGRV